MTNFTRRNALKMSASFALAAAAGGFSCIEMAKAGPIEVPDRQAQRPRSGRQRQRYLLQAAGSQRREDGAWPFGGFEASAAQRMGISLLLEPSAAMKNAPSCWTMVGRQRPSTATWIC